MPKLWRMGLVTGPILGDEPGFHVPEGIWIKLDGYDQKLNTELKQTLPAPFRWNRDKQRWEFPLHWDTCTGARKVANKHGADIRITSQLTEWAEQERQRQETIPDVQSMDLVDLPAVRKDNPAIWSALRARPFQTVGAAFAARNRSCLIADEPGLGKTLQTIAAVIESGTTGPILVVAPKAAAQLTWPQELKHWAPNDAVVVVGSNIGAKWDRPASAVRGAQVTAASNHAGGAGGRVWIITSPNYLRIRAEVDEYGNYVKDKGQKRILPVQEAIMELFDVEWSAIIVDDSHQTLAGCTGNKKKQSAQRVGLGALNVKKDGLRIALSGTPFRGKESYLWGQLNWLRPDLFRSYRRWIEQHFDTWFDGFGWQTGLLKNRAAMYDEAKSVMIRRTKAEVAKDLPAKAYGGVPLLVATGEAEMPVPPKGLSEDDFANWYQSEVEQLGPVAVWLDMEPKQAKAYASMIKRAEAELEGGTLLVTSMLAELTRLKQLAGSCGRMDGDKFVPALPSNKFNWLVEFLDERGIDKDMLRLKFDGKANTRNHRSDVPKVVVATQFSQFADCIADGLAKLGIPSYLFTGNTSDKDREAIKDDWQNNPISSTRVLILTTTAGGTSLTLDAADDLVVLDETWNPDDQQQVEDRLHRLSRIHQVTIWKVFSRNTIEETIARKNMESEASIKSIIDGQRGVDYYKELLSA